MPMAIPSLVLTLMSVALAEGFNGYCAMWCNPWTRDFEMCNACSGPAPPVPPSLPKCFRATDNPPNIYGVFELSTSASLKYKNESDFAQGLILNEGRRRVVRNQYTPTSPPNPFFAEANKYDWRVFEAPEPCVWVHSYCAYTLYCADHADTGYKLQTPIEIDDADNVLSFALHKIEMGPAYLIAPGVPNPNQEPLVGRTVFTRVELD